MTLQELLQRIDIGEDQDTEFKLAEGGLPKSLWETLSAFANTAGGYVILGVEERGSGRMEVAGVKKPNALRQDFWNGHNNPQKLSTPLCMESDVAVVSLEGRQLLIIHVPQASRTQRPVYINGNPITGAFKRNFEGDYRCTEAEIRQMFRDAGDEPQDAQILDGFDLSDLDADSLTAYRNRFASRDPDHAFLALGEWDFLERLGALRRDRRTGQEGLTLAGLLMFGRERPLLDALPRFHLDYQERLSDDPDVRWTFRLTLDGKWEPNLFNFYYRVYPRLVEGLNVPFKLDKDAVRLGETHVHEALREALVNTLIHADHLSSRPLTVIKLRDAFVFANPGRLRIPREALYQGSVSDPRNPNLQKMFQMLGLGEKAGSGFQKILRAWREQQWFWPFVEEDTRLEMTRITLLLESMVPEEVERELREVVGEAYGELQDLDRVILMLAHRFGEVSNESIQPYRREHPRDIGERLKVLVSKGWLAQDGRGRGTRYRLPGSGTSDLFQEMSEASSEHYAPGSEHYASSSEHYSTEQCDALSALAAPVRNKPKVAKGLVEETILALCSEDWRTLRTLAGLLGRESDSLRNHYINPMLRDGRLIARVPGKPNHPNQAYKKKPA